MAGWLIGWLFGCLVVWLFGVWLFGCLVVWLLDCLADWVEGGLGGRRRGGLFLLTWIVRCWLSRFLLGLLCPAFVLLSASVA